MDATLQPPSQTDDRERARVLAALDRGELVLMLAELDAGKISQENLDAALERHVRQGGIWRKLCTFFL